MSGNDSKLDNMNEDSIMNAPTGSYSKYDTNIWCNAIKNIAWGFAFTFRQHLIYSNYSIYYQQ